MYNLSFDHEKSCELGESNRAEKEEEENRVVSIFLSTLRPFFAYFLATCNYDSCVRVFVCCAKKKKKKENVCSDDASLSQST